MKKTDKPIFIVIGPTGAGKSSVLAEAFKRRPDIQTTVSCTTRKIRPGEIDGVHYRFVSRARFICMIIFGRLLEWERNPLGSPLAQFYGTPKSELRGDVTKAFEVDLVGALNIKKMFPQTKIIFITAPMETLRQRVIQRSNMTEEELAGRIKRAEDEIREGKANADYVIMNDGTLDEAVDKLVAVFDEIAPRTP